jgi:hypothetical protein
MHLIQYIPLAQGTVLHSGPNRKGDGIFMHVAWLKVTKLHHQPVSQQKVII